LHGSPFLKKWSTALFLKHHNSPAIPLVIDLDLEDINSTLGYGSSIGATIPGSGIMQGSNLMGFDAVDIDRTRPSSKLEIKVAQLP
jgi:hypothetical protein